MIYQFSNFELDSVNFSLKNQGKMLEVEPQVFNLIVYLIKNRSRLLTRDEIFEVLWNEKEVLDATLSNHIKIARAILGDDGQSQSIIKTIRGRGYQFIATVKELNSLSQNSSKKIVKSRSLQFILLFVLLLVGLIIIFKYTGYSKSIKNTNIVAVLPLLNSKPDPTSNYLGLAIADQIIGEFTYLNNISVRPSSIIRKYTSHKIEPKSIGEILNVDYVLTGSYLNIKDKVQFNLELIDVETGKLLWRENNIQFNFLEPQNLRDIIKNELSTKLSFNKPVSKNKVTQRSMPKNALAYELYLKSISQPFSTDGNKVAIELLKSSIAIDDYYAPAYSQLGNRIRRYEQYGLITSKETLKAFQYYEKALSINGELLSALSYLAFYYCETNRLEEALELANKIIQINPDSADSHFTLGYVYRYAGLIEEAIYEMEQAVNMDPQNSRYRSLVSTYSGARFFKKAQDLVDTYQESSFTLGWDGLIAYRMGDYKSSLFLLEKLKAQGSNGLWALVSKIYIHYMKNEKAKGLLSIHELEQTNTTDSETVYYIAVYYGMYDDKARSLHALQKAVDGGYYNYIFMQNSEFFDSFRDDIEFQRIIEVARIKSMEFRKKVKTGVLLQQNN